MYPPNLSVTAEPDRTIRLQIYIRDQDLRLTDQKASLQGIGAERTLSKIIEVVEQGPAFPHDYHVDAESVMVEDTDRQRSKDVVDALFRLWQQGDTPKLLVTAEKDENLVSKEVQQSPSATAPEYPSRVLTDAELETLVEQALSAPNKHFDQPVQQDPTGVEDASQDANATLSQDPTFDTSSQAIELIYEYPPSETSEASEASEALIETVQRRLDGLPEDKTLRQSMARAVIKAMDEEEERWMTQGLVEPAQYREGG